MKVDFLTLVLASFFVGYIISAIKDRSKNKTIRAKVAKYIESIKTALSIDKNSLSAVEYNDRYTITFNREELSKIGMIRLLKSEKKLVLTNGSLQLTDQEYENLLETIKVIL